MASNARMDRRLPEFALFALSTRRRGVARASPARPHRYPGIRAILDEHDDDALARLMTNLAGQTWLVLDPFMLTDDGRPLHRLHDQGYGLPFAATRQPRRAG